MSVKHITAPVNFFGSVDVEPPAKLDTCIFFGQNTVGAFTYFSPVCEVSNAVIGRYCSVGRDVIIGPGSHYVDFLTTHPIGSDPSGMSAGMLGNPLYKAFALNSPISSPKESKITHIGNDVWIGSRSIIMQGVKIGDGAIIGAGSVVTKDVPSFSVFAGVPSKLIRYRFIHETLIKVRDSEWWKKDLSKISNRDFSDIDKMLSNLGELPEYSPKWTRYEKF